MKFSEVVGYRYVTRGDGRVSDAMKYALKEILKNAVAYGNKFDLSVPIFVRIDPQTFSVAVLNGVSPSRPLRKDELLRAGLGGFGKAMRYLASLCGYKYSLQKEATWAYAKAEFPRDVVAGGGASLIAHISRVQQAYLDSRRDSRGKLQKISVLDFIAVNYICSLPGPGLYSLTGQGIFTTARWQFRACSIHGRWLFPLEKFFYDTVFSKWLPFLAVSECSVSPFARWILKRAIDADSYAVIVTKSGSCR